MVLLHYNDEKQVKKDLFNSRLLVLFWGIALSLFAIELDSLRGKVNVVVLAFGMVSYTTGPMLGMFLAALFTPQAKTVGLAMGFALSFLLVAYIRPDFYQILINFEVFSARELAGWKGIGEEDGKLKPILNSAWAWPVTVFLTWGCGLLPGRKLQR